MIFALCCKMLFPLHCPPHQREAAVPFLSVVFWLSLRMVASSRGLLQVLAIALTYLQIAPQRHGVIMWRRRNRRLQGKTTDTVATVMSVAESDSHRYEIVNPKQPTPRSISPYEFEELEWPGSRKLRNKPKVKKNK